MAAVLQKACAPRTAPSTNSCATPSSRGPSASTTAEPRSVSKAVPSDPTLSRRSILRSAMAARKWRVAPSWTAPERFSPPHALPDATRRRTVTGVSTAVQERVSASAAHPRDSRSVRRVPFRRAVERTAATGAAPSSRIAPDSRSSTCAPKAVRPALRERAAGAVSGPLRQRVCTRPH